MAQEITNGIELQVVAIWRDLNNNNMQTERFSNIVQVTDATDRATYLVKSALAIKNATEYTNNN